MDPSVPGLHNHARLGAPADDTEHVHPRSRAALGPSTPSCPVQPNSNLSDWGGRGIFSQQPLLLRPPGHVSLTSLSPQSSLSTHPPSEHVPARNSPLARRPADPQHRASWRGTADAQMQARGKGLSGVPGSWTHRGWLVLLPGLGPQLSHFVDTAGGFLWAARRGGRHPYCARSGCPSLGCPAGPSRPRWCCRSSGSSMGAGRREGPQRGRGKQHNCPPPCPFRLATSSEWAGCGIPIILCRAGMWKPDPGPVVWGGGGGGVHSTEGKGAGQQTCQAGLPWGGGLLAPPPGSRTPAASTPPPALN